MLNVNEIFQSIQGEGAQAGIPAIFLRLQGCNLRCPWCDTKGALDPKGGTVMSLEAVLEKINQYAPNLVVVTGGEPLLQARPLAKLINDLDWDYHRHQWHLETNGTWAPPPTWIFDWITVSPKPPDYFIHPAYASSGQHINELKIVVTADDTFGRIWNYICGLDSFLKDTIICLQPVDNDLDIARKIVGFLGTIGEPLHQWRLSLQLHKILEVK